MAHPTAVNDQITDAVANQSEETTQVDQAAVTTNDQQEQNKDEDQSKQND